MLTPDRYAVGQNVATTWSYSRTPPSKDKPEFKRHVMGWFDEVTRFQWRARDIEPFNFRMDTGHYTQVSPLSSLSSYFIYFKNISFSIYVLCSWCGPTPTWLAVATLTTMTTREDTANCTSVTTARGATWWEDHW